MPKGLPLTEGEIHHRLIRLSNLEGLHAAARERVRAVERENVRDLVYFAVTVLDQTYSQVRTLLEGLCGFRLTDGETAAIVRERGVRWRPAYERLKARIRDGPGVHLDETGWLIQDQGHRTFAWVRRSSGLLGAPPPLCPGARGARLCPRRNAGRALRAVVHPASRAVRHP